MSSLAIAARLLCLGLRHSVTGGTNKYLYNGKELQDELGQYDYSFAVDDSAVFMSSPDEKSGSVMGRGSELVLNSVKRSGDRAVERGRSVN